MIHHSHKSKLANSEICQKCAKCCLTFSWAEEPDMATRFAWIKDKNLITVKDTPFNNQEVTLHVPCSKLSKIGDKYVCSVWGKDQPHLCATYPDHMFYGVKKEDRKTIQKIIDWAKFDCPLFENITVDEIIKKLF